MYELQSVMGVECHTCADAIQVLSKTMDSTTLSPDKLELSTVRKDKDSDEVIFTSLPVCNLAALFTCATLPGITQRQPPFCYCQIVWIVSL